MVCALEIKHKSDKSKIIGKILNIAKPKKEAIKPGAGEGEKAQTICMAEEVASRAT